MDKSLKITIEIIDHLEQRYPTVGDWQITPDGLRITVSKLGDFFEESCVGVHELVEALICIKRGISQFDVDKFDMEFEKKRLAGNLDEPGDSPDAPYKKEHFFATNIERLLTAELGIDWKTYNDKVEGL